MGRWDIFCTVVDNFGDIGTCWRLAQQLAHEHDAHVRLWVDKLESFAPLCPAIVVDAATQHVGPVEIRHWPSDFPTVQAEDVADVVIEAFACEIPERYISAMARRAVAPVWINLEYLSAEGWVEDCHLRPSPHPRWPLTKYFFFPGFRSGTGGLLRERGLIAARAAFDAAAESGFWHSLGIAPRTGGGRRTDNGLHPGGNGLHPNGEPVIHDESPADDELRVSLFCYDNPALPGLLQCWTDGPAAVRVFAAPGAATDQIARWFGTGLSQGMEIRRDSLTVQALPFLPQPVYDRLLWSCDVNFVRGEDSFVRAQWAARPFVWQIYPQAGNAHVVKLDAFLARYLDGFEGSDPDVVRRCFHGWNGTDGMAVAWRNFATDRPLIERHGKVWANQLDRQRDLANNLALFAREK